MEKKYIIITLFVILIAVVLILFYISSGMQRTFKAEVLKGLDRTASINNQVITVNDIINLPEPVQRYLNYVGVIGKEKVYNVRIVSETDINLGPQKGWSKMSTFEYDFYDKRPSRLAYMKFKMKGLPVFGLDSYINTNGRMLMKPGGLFAVVDEKGHTMDDTSAAVMLLLSMCTSAPSALIDDRIQWTNVDPLTVNAIFNDNGCKISATLKFNDIGELINFSSEDKYNNPTGKEYLKMKWSTPVMNYKVINGLKLPTYGEAIWHYPEGEQCYGRNTLKEIEYNCRYFK